MISQEELKSLEVQILEKVDKFCEDNDLTYYLAYGTLLGAVRHKGFIPWDDDIDIKMPRKDYERFIDSFSCEGLSVYSHRHTNGFFYPFAKVSDDATILKEKSHIVSFDELGVYIDVFPVDFLPNNRVLRYFTIIKSKLFRYIYISKTIKVDVRQGLSKQIVSKIIRSLAFFISTSNLLILWDRSLMKCQEMKYLGCMVWGYGKREVMRSKEILPTTRIIFEGKQYKAPQNVDYYLKRLYDNYLVLPPVEKQVTHHDFVAEYKERFSELKK